MGGLSSAIALAGLVVFATEASAHDNSVTGSGTCVQPAGAGATITWTIANDYPETETGTVSSVNGGSFAYQGGASSFTVAPNASTTVTETFTSAQLANLFSTLPSPATVSLQWTANWQGDGFSTYAGPGNDNGNASHQGFFNLDTLPSGCRPTPTVTTTAAASSEAVGAGALADSATLSGGSSPTGTITFYLFDPSQTCSATPAGGSYTFTQQFSVNGNATYGPTTGGPNPTILGTWHWLAVYSGDSNNLAANSGCGSEPVTVSLASPTVTTAAVPTDESVGTGPLNDTADLSGGDNPTGTITFYLFSPSQTCSATPAGGSYTFSQPIAVSGDRDYGPTVGGPNPTIAGTWHWVAVYSGDSDNNPGNSGCASEPVWINKASPTVTTKADPTSEPVCGCGLSDSATLRGGDNPTGTITFYLFSPRQTCSATPADGSYTFSQEFTVDGDGDYGPTTGGPFPTIAGTWNWVAVYSGDSQNNPTNSGCGSEPVTISKTSPKLTTTASPTTATVGGSGLNDTADLSAGTSPTGTITFYLFSPSQTCTATPAAGSYTFTQQVSVKGDGTYSTTGGPTPTTAGTWNWVAVYSGDADNNATKNSGCGTEPVTVSAAPTTITTQQSASSSGEGTIVLGGSVTDTATITSSGAGTPTGTVAFTECGPTSSAQPCSSGTVVGSAVPLTSGTATSAAFAPTQVGTYCFAAVYTPAVGSSFSSSQDNTTRPTRRRPSASRSRLR